MYDKLQDREWLKTEYVEKRRTLQAIGDEIGCHKGTVGRAMRRLGLKRRKRTARYAELENYDWLYEQYAVQKRGLNSIAKELGTSPGNVREHLVQKGIPVRKVREGMALNGIEAGKRLGADAANWQGGRRKLRTGYIYRYAPDHPYCTKTGYVMEHRLVMEEKLGRYLKPGEVVHHIDGNKSHNCIDNLELKLNGQHISEDFEASHEVTQLRKQVKDLERENKRLKAKLEKKGQ